MGRALAGRPSLDAFHQPGDSGPDPLGAGHDLWEALEKLYAAWGLRDDMLNPDAIIPYVLPQLRGSAPGHRQAQGGQGRHY
jgi:hypothetical protein